MSDPAFTIWFSLVLICLVVSIPLAGTIEHRLQARFPNIRPYKWGAFVGCAGLTSVLFIPSGITIGLASDASNEDRMTALFVLCYFMTHGLCGWYILQRKRWAWIVATILWPNPIYWIINGIYASRRWAEFSAEAGGATNILTAPSGIPPAPPAKTISVARDLDALESRLNPKSQIEPTQKREAAREIRKTEFFNMTPPSARKIEASRSPAAERLRQLKEIHDAGLISDEEFHSKRTEILKTL